MDFRAFGMVFVRKAKIILISDDFIAPTIFRNVPGTGMYFLTLDFLKRTKFPDSAITNLFYGSISRVIAGQILMPFTVLKINQEV